MSSLKILSLPQPIIVLDTSNEFLDWLATWRQRNSSHNSQVTWICTVVNSEGEAISIKHIRDLQENLTYSLRPTEGRDIVFLATEQCSPVAQHALLKMLEEPKLQRKFWLVTNSPSHLLETIHSRCHLLTMNELIASSSLSEHSNSATKATTIEVQTQSTMDPFSSIITDAMSATTQPTPGGVLSAMQKTGTDREQTTEMVRALLLSLREDSDSHIHQQQACLDALDWLEANAHVGLTRDNLAITLWQLAQQKWCDSMVFPSGEQPPVARG